MSHYKPSDIYQGADLLGYTIHDCISMLLSDKKALQVELIREKKRSDNMLELMVQLMDRNPDFDLLVNDTAHRIKKYKIEEQKLEAALLGITESINSYEENCQKWNSRPKAYLTRIRDSYMHQIFDVYEAVNNVLDGLVKENVKLHKLNFGKMNEPVQKVYDGNLLEKQYTNQPSELSTEIHDLAMTMKNLSEKFKQNHDK